MERGSHRLGRPSSYTPEIAERICERLAAGEALVSICDDSEMPGYSTVHRWLSPAGGESFAAFREEHARAREAQADGYAEAVIRESRKAIGQDGAGVQAQKLIVDSLKWTAARMAPKRWGDKIDVGLGQSETREPMKIDSEVLNSAERVKGVEDLIRATLAQQSSPDG